MAMLQPVLVPFSPSTPAGDDVVQDGTLSREEVEKNLATCHGVVP